MRSSETEILEGCEAPAHLFQQDAREVLRLPSDCWPSAVISNLPFGRNYRAGEGYCVVNPAVCVKCTEDVNEQEGVRECVRCVESFVICAYTDMNFVSTVIVQVKNCPFLHEPVYGCDGCM